MKILSIVLFTWLTFHSTIVGVSAQELIYVYYRHNTPVTITEIAYESITPRHFINQRRVMGPTVRRTFSGIAGNQPPGGSRFPTGGSFFWSAAGGPSVTASVAFGAGFGSISVSVPIGNSANTGQIVGVPNRVNYFHLHVSRTYDIQAWREYIQLHTGQWIHARSGTNRRIFSQALSSVRAR